MPKPFPARPAHRQDTVISILVAGTLRSEAPLKDMAGRVAGAAGGCETGAARGGGGGARPMCRRGGGGGGCAPSSPACALAARAFTVAGRTAAPDGNATPPGPRGAPTPLEQPPIGQEPYTDPNSNSLGGRVLPVHLPEERARPAPTRAVQDADRPRIPSGHWGRLLFLSCSLNNLLLPLATPAFPQSLNRNSYTFVLISRVTLGKLLNIGRVTGRVSSLVRMALIAHTWGVVKFHQDNLQTGFNIGDYTQ